MPMEPAALLLLKENRVVQQMIASWPKVKIHSKNPKLTRKRWSEAAGIRVYEVEQWAPMLFVNEICGPKGFVDNMARAYITRIAMRGMPKPKGP
jgi:hypothetical protein